MRLFALLAITLALPLTAFAANDSGAAFLRFQDSAGVQHFWSSANPPTGVTLDDLNPSLRADGHVDDSKMCYQGHPEDLNTMIKQVISQTASAWKQPLQSEGVGFDDDDDYPYIEFGALDQTGQLSVRGYMLLCCDESKICRPR